MSWMDSWSRPSKHAVTPPPLYLTVGDAVPYCHTCGRVISDRRKNTSSQSTVKYCSARCRNSKPGPTDRRIEDAFVALLDGKTIEDVVRDSQNNTDKTVESKEQETKSNAKSEAETGTTPQTFGKHSKNHKKKSSKGTNTTKGDHRIIVQCETAENAVFQREKDPEKVYGRRKNRRARFVVEKPEDWRSVDMVDQPKGKEGEDADSSDEDSDSSSVSEAEGERDEGGVQLSKTATQTSSTSQEQQDMVPLSSSSTTYGYGSGKVRPPQALNDVNGSVGGEKGWAERMSQETDEMKAKRREGQRRADEREMVRKAARRACAFGLKVEGEEERRKCEAVMKGAVVEASFAKGEWGIRWRERV